MRLLRTLLIGWSLIAAPVAAQAAVAAPAKPAAPARDIVRIDTPGQRASDLFVYTSAGKPRAVVIVSHGGGSAPDRMMSMIAPLTAAGFAVIAPRHGDSTSLPADQRQPLQAALGSRIGDMHAAAGYAARRFAGLPVGALGYSYGSLTALIAAGALDYTGMPAVPAVKAVATFSSPGIIPGLIMPERAFAKVTVPTLMISGDADRVPGFVTNPDDHLLAFRTAPAGGRTALWIKGATHELIGADTPEAVTARRAAVDFLIANLTGDKLASQRFNALKSRGSIEVQRR